MRIPINLASDPFRRDRPIIVASAVISGLMLATLVMFISLAVSERHRSADARQNVAKLETQLRGLAAEQSRLEGVLRQTENAAVLDKTQFINMLLLRKGVSWTKMFADLEKVVPHNVRLISVRPQINARNEILLDMTVGSQTQEPVHDFLMALEAAPQFGTTTFHSSQAPTQNEPLYRYRISVQYAQKL